MKNNTPFDLEKAIDTWQEKLSNTGNFNDEEQRELVSHLRDELDNLQGKALRDEERLLIAQQRLGSVSTLEAAYGHQSLGIKQLIWGLQGLMMFWFFSNLTALFNWVGGDIILTYKLDERLTKYSVSFGLQAIGLVITLLVIRHLVKMHKSGQATFRSNIFLVSALAVSIGCRLVYLKYIGSVTAIYEPIVVSGVALALAPLITMVMVVLLSWREYRSHKIRPAV